MRGSRKFCQSYKSRKFCHRYKWAIIGPPAKRIEMAFCWRADDAEDPDQYCKETLHVCAFSEGGSRPPVPPAPPNKEIILILIDRPHARNLSSGLELRGFRPCQTRIKLLRKTYRKV